MVIYYVFLMYDSTEFLVGNWRSVLAVMFTPHSIPLAVQSQVQRQPAGTSTRAVPPAMVPSPPPQADARTRLIRLGTATSAAPDWSKNQFDGLESTLRVKAALHLAGLSPDQDGNLLLAVLLAVQRFKAQRTADDCAADSIVEFVNGWPQYKKLYDIAKKLRLSDEGLERLIHLVSALCQGPGDANEVDNWVDFIQKAKLANLSPQDFTLGT